MSRDEAVIFMVDSNLQREAVLPSEKAYSYKMKLDAIRRKAGRPAKDNLRPVVGKFESAAIVGNDSGDSGRQIQRYIRLTELIDPILGMVDENKIAFRPAVEISYLPEDEQEALHQTMEAEDCTPSLAQAIKMKKFSQEGHLNADVILSIMAEEKGNQIEQFKMPQDRISKFFSPGTPKEKIESDIVKGLELLRKRERDRRDAR
jgi:ParB family chromosome partitioning protein